MTPAVMVAVVAVVVGMVGVEVGGLAERTSSSIYILLKMHTTASQLARPKPTSSDSWAACQ